MEPRRGGPPPDRGPASVPLDDFVRGRLPGVCAVTGRAAEVNLRVRVWAVPGWPAAGAATVWVVLAALLGVVAGPLWLSLYEVGSFVVLLVALRLTRPGAAGALPVSGVVAAHVHLRRTLAFDVGVGAAASLGLGYVALLTLGGTGDGVRVAYGRSILGVLLGVVSLVMAAVAARSTGVRARLTRDPAGHRWVELRGVHPGFSAALDELRRVR